MAGVSLGTASSVLTGRSGFRVSVETAKRIRHAANELGYQPNRLARALATGKTRLIALIDYDFGASFSAHLGRHFHHALGADHYDLIIVGQATSPEAVASMVDGAICISRSVPSGIEELLPVVQVSPVPDTGQDSLTLDFESATLEAMNLFQQIGCQSVVFLGHSTGSYSVDGRILAYRDFVRRTGQPEILLPSAMDRAVEGYESMARYAAEHGWPQGVFCRNDELAVGAYRAIREAGLKVGRDVAVIGCDDIGGEFQEPPLTSIAVPFDELSSLAWRLLQERIETRDLPARAEVITPKLVERASSTLNP